MWLKFCVALVTKYDIFLLQNLEPLSYFRYTVIHTIRLAAMLLQHQRLVNIDKNKIGQHFA